MVKQKKKAPAGAHGVAAATRRAKMERASQYTDSVWRNLNALKAAPKMKHRSYFEAVENADKKKKKLEFEITTDIQPPPGFEFIPTGHPELSQECKERSRDRDAMYFIVSISKNALRLDHHMNRLGYHFRCTIVDEARQVLNEAGRHEQAAYVYEPGKPEPIPNSQAEMNLEADAVLRDLFPRIPNTDRQEIIDHAFKKDGKFNGDLKVGMAKDITLARRVQLAALAHIRHTHTRYDQLLRESDWANARKAVEKPCLDLIVKWRGDEETGRDQLDEILREVIEISDSESDSEYEADSADNARVGPPRTRSMVASTLNVAVSRPSLGPHNHIGVTSQTSSPGRTDPLTPARQRNVTRAEFRTARKTQKRFKRYAAAAEALASSSDQVGQGSIPGYVAVAAEVVRRQGSAHPVNAYRATPSTVVPKTHSPRTPYGHSEYRRMPVSQSDSTHDTLAGRSYIPVDSHMNNGSEQFIRVPDAYRPKVGPYSANQSHSLPAPPLSPVRMGLQDLLLPSIEPGSPDVRVAPDSSHRLQGEGQQFAAQSPRVIPRTIVEPAGSAHRPQSPAPLGTNGGGSAKRRRVTTYFPEDYQESPSSYVRAPPRHPDDALYRPQIGYLADGRPEIQERVVYQDASWALPGQDLRAHRPGDRPGVNQYHPVAVPSDSRSPLVSMAPDRIVHPSNQRVYSQGFPAHHVDAPLRSRANPIMIDGDGNYEPRRVIEVRGPPANDIYRTASPRLRPLHGSQIRGESRMRDVSRIVYVDDTTDRFRGEPTNRHYQDYRPYPRVGNAYEAGAPQPRADIIYREVARSDTRVPQQPFPVYPAPSSYVEIRGPPAQQRVSDHREMIYLE
ncbi:hypothetical protein F4808DRAFT_434907 [Astrocystis sublimbata]|nr:hypothetical protein F4808DRAFT_434907 [Astrocystis sublimbata]